MNIVSFIIERFAELSTILLSMFFLYRTLDTKISIKYQKIVGMFFICIRMFYYNMDFGYHPYFSLIAGVFYSKLVFVGKLRKHMIWNIIPIVIDGAIDTSIISFYLLFPNTSLANVDLPGTVRIIIILVAKILLFMTYYLVTLKIDKDYVLQWADITFLFFGTIGCWIMLELQFCYENKLAASVYRPLLATGSVTLLFIISTVVMAYNRITANFRELTRSQLQLRMLEMTQEHIGQINEFYIQLSALRHDLHNHFSAINGYLNAKDYEHLEEYINTLTNINLNFQEYVKNPVLNALIGTRISMAKSENIDFHIDLHLPEHIPISDVDLCILVSNILDNAFDASKVAFEPRFIHLYSRIINSSWVIVCRNATKKSGKFRSSGNIKSTKDAVGIHGIGTKEIKFIAEKTGGFVTYKHDNYEFCTLVTLGLSHKNNMIFD